MPLSARAAPPVRVGAVIAGGLAPAARLAGRLPPLDLLVQAREGPASGRGLDAAADLGGAPDVG